MSETSGWQWREIAITAGIALLVSVTVLLIVGAVGERVSPSPSPEAR